MISLSQTQIISISVNSAIFAILTIASLILVNKINLQEKGYKYLFWLYTMFWVPIMLVRPYRGTMQNAIDNDATLVAIVLSVYGIIGIFIRLFADVISYLFKYRKAFLYFSIILEIILFIPLVVNPTSATNIVSAIGIGVGASCIGTYELLFKEQYGNKKAFLTVSVLSIPPLLANFLTAPVQSIMKTVATNNDKVVDPLILRYMWVISLGFLLIVFVMLFFLKEKRMETPMVNTKTEKLTLFEKTSALDVSLFVGLCIIGSLVAFIKFSNSDSVATTHLQNLAKLNNLSSAAYEGYISVIFSLFQLVAGVLMGLYLVKKIDVIKIFLIGSSAWVVYTIASSFIANPYAYLAIHGINGFGYGILYNLVLALVLKVTMDKKIITKMGIYQSVLSIGVAVSGFFTTWMKEAVIGKVDPNTIDLNTYMKSYLIQNMVLLGVVILITIAFVVMMIIVNDKSDSFKLNKKESESKDSVWKSNFKKEIANSKTKILNKFAIT